ncbi:class II fumarate hydratase [Salinispira pacifica]
MAEKHRTESDTMGKVELPEWAYWGAQTQRAVENFTVSDARIPRAMVRALALIKKYAARTNAYLGVLDEKLAGAIDTAATEVLEGKWKDHFPIDVYQTGSGTSWNMNMNEVVANRANELLGQPLGTKKPVHPNDHVNRGQSSNDVIPAAVHIADRMEAEKLISSLEKLHKALSERAAEFAEVVKIGRTHLQDAVPMTLGQEFSGYAAQIEKAIRRVRNALPSLEELALGGTAVGTGINCDPEFAPLVCKGIAEHTDLPFKPAANKFEAIATRDAQVELMGVLNTVATSLMKIANDLRLLASGPRAGLGEITLPSLQPGSSIMPGKVNPVIPEMVIQVAAHVCGQAVAVTIGGQNAPLELNMMNPLIAYETLSAMELLTRTAAAFADKCIAGITADEERASYWIEWSLALVTPLATEIGYDRASAIAYRAFKEKRAVREVAREEKVLPDERLDELLDPKKMI